MIKVIVIGKLKNVNSEYFDYCKRIEEKRIATSPIGLIDYSTEIKDDVEITISSWKTWDNMLDWAHDPLQKEAKEKEDEWYYWVKGIHIKAEDD